MTTTSDRPALDELDRKRQLVAGLGGPERVQRQHDRGLLTARERIELLCDPGSVYYFGSLAHSGIPGEEERTFGDGQILAFGEIDGRPVATSATDATIKGGSGGFGSRRRGEAFARIVKDAHLPKFDLAQGGGARITQILGSRFTGYAGPGLGDRLAFPRTHSHFVAVLGNYYAPWNVADADFSVMTKRSNFSVSSPPVIEEATSERVTAEEVGGWEVHARTTGQIDRVTEDDAEAISMLRRIFAYLPANPWEDPPVVASEDPVQRDAPELRSLVPDHPLRPYDVRKAINAVVDRDSFLEFQPDFARNLVTGLARIDGHSVAIMGNQPFHAAGSLDVDSGLKLRRLLQACEAFGLPLVSMIDVPGVMPTLRHEHNRLLMAVYGAMVDRLRTPVPKISVFMRKAYGLALWTMSGADPEWFSFAWPSAQLAFIGPEPGVRVAYRREWESAPDPDEYMRTQAALLRRDAEPWEAGELGYIDAVIDPAQTRSHVAAALRVARERMRHRRWRRPEAR